LKTYIKLLFSFLLNRSLLCYILFPLKSGNRNEGLYEEHCFAKIEAFRGVKKGSEWTMEDYLYRRNQKNEASVREQGK